jgi:hypothetical protein
MRDRLEKIIESLFSIFLIIAIAGGGIVFLMFVIGIIVGGTTGNSLAVNANSVMLPIFIRSAAIAVLLGLIQHYVIGEHVLTMDEKD